MDRAGGPVTPQEKSQTRVREKRVRLGSVLQRWGGNAIFLRVSLLNVHPSAV
uniref:Uncharacterized protein n=1 Tax=Anguilla anguilla TaxID=7936 RepID=A0A0E9T7U3_ANGAN